MQTSQALAADLCRCCPWQGDRGCLATLPCQALPASLADLFATEEHRLQMRAAQYADDQWKVSWLDEVLCFPAFESTRGGAEGEKEKGKRNERTDGRG